MAVTNNVSDFLSAVASAIRTRKGTSGTINAQNFASQIRSISQTVGPQLVTPSISAGHNLINITDSNTPFTGIYDVYINGEKKISTTDTAIGLDNYLSSVSSSTVAVGERRQNFQASNLTSALTMTKEADVSAYAPHDFEATGDHTTLQSQGDLLDSLTKWNLNDPCIIKFGTNANPDEDCYQKFSTNNLLIPLNCNLTKITFTYNGSANFTGTSDLGLKWGFCEGGGADSDDVIYGFDVDFTNNTYKTVTKTITDTSVLNSIKPYMTTDKVSYFCIYATQEYTGSTQYQVNLRGIKIELEWEEQ